MGDLSDLVGIPFVDRGRTKEGADCYGLFMLVLERFGIEVPPVDVSAFSSEEVYREFQRQLPLWREINGLELRAGDAVAIRNDPGMPQLIQHFGVYIGGGRFIHTLQKTGSITARLDHPFWKFRIAGYYRWNR